MMLSPLLGALIDLGGTGHYIHWGFIQLSVANLVVIIAMIVVFALAIIIPFPRHGGKDE
jgi:ABC-type proline/glycine betaine transport system permease subunit